MMEITPAKEVEGSEYEPFLLEGLPETEDESAIVLSEIEKCRNSFSYYLFTYVKTHDSEGNVLRFPQWQYLIDLAKVLEGPDLTIMIYKGRKMLISWLMAIYTHWEINFFERVDDFIISQGEVEARDFAADRVPFIHFQLPEWLRSPVEYDNKSELVICHNQETKSFSKIKSLPSTTKAGRHFQGKTFILDEAAFMQYGYQLYQAANPAKGSKGRMILITTPNPENPDNFFRKLWHAPNDFKKIELDGSLLPERTAEWETKERKKYIFEQGGESWMFDVEYHLKEDMPTGLAVYATFNKAKSVKEISFNPYLPVLVGIDCGFPQGAVACQIDFSNLYAKISILRELCGESKAGTIGDFARQLLNILQNEFPVRRPFQEAFEFYGDPQLGHKTDVSWQTRYQVIMEETKGLINISWGQRWSVEAITLIRPKLNLMPDGEPNLFIRPSCKKLIAGFSGGYRYEEGKVGMSVKKNDYAHVMNALEFIVNNKLDTTEQRPREGRKRLIEWEGTLGIH